MESSAIVPTVDFSSLPVELDFNLRSPEISSDRDTPRSESTTGSRRDQLQKLSSNPIFQDLQSTLRFECDAQEGIPSALLASTGHVTTLPVTVRVSQINMRFLQLSSHGVTRNQAFQLQSFYVQTSAQLESARLTALGNVHGNPWLLNSVNAQYDLQHHGLLDRVGQSLKLVENKITNPGAKVTNPETLAKRPGKPGTITSDAVCVMTSWYVIYMYVIYMYVCICACMYICTCYHYVPSLCKMYYLHFVFKNNYYCNLFLLNHGGMFIYKLISFFHSPFQHPMYFYFHIYCNTCTYM